MFAHAAGNFTGTVSPKGLLPRNPDGSCAVGRPLLYEVDMVAFGGTRTPPSWPNRSPATTAPHLQAPGHGPAVIKTAPETEEGPCGWLKDRYGLSWQIVPVRLAELLNDPDEAAAQRVMAAMLKMTRIDIAELERAYAGGA